MRASFYTVFIFVLALGIGGFSWSQSNYVIDAQLNIEEERMVVSQKIEFKNETSSPLQTLYFYDWANSYQGAPAPWQVILPMNLIGVFISVRIVNWDILKSIKLKVLCLLNNGPG